MATIEEKAKAYDEAIKKAKSVIEQNPLMEYLKKGIEYIFPVLKENEDEETRKELIKFVKSRLAGFPECDKFVAWIEKQGEHKPQGKSALEAIKEEKVDNRNYIKLIDKIEPKFKVGDWIVYKDTVWKVCNISLLNYYELLKINNEVSTRRIEDVDKNARLWTIQDAKDGDMLSYNDGHGNDCIELIKSITGKKIEFWFCLTNGNSYEVFDGIIPYTNLVSREDATPATKEQRDLLFQKMKEAGYEWDAEKKEMKKVEQKHKSNIVPIFKEGDIIKNKKNGDTVKVEQILSDSYCYSGWDGAATIHSDFLISEQDDWELVEQKPAGNSSKSSEESDVVVGESSEYKNGFECGKQYVLKYPEEFNLCKKPSEWSK